MCSSEGRASTIEQMLNLRRHDHAVVVAAEVRKEPHGLECVLREREQAAREALETAIDLEHVLAVVAYRHGLAVGTDGPELLDDLPGLGVNRPHLAVTG